MINSLESIIEEEGTIFRHNEDKRIYLKKEELKKLNGSKEIIIMSNSEYNKFENEKDYYISENRKLLLKIKIKRMK